MNVAFPALVALLAILPGLMLRYAYAVGGFGLNSPTKSRRITEGLAYGLPLALVLHVVWLGVVRGLGFQPDIDLAVSLLAGSGANNSVATNSSASAARVIAQSFPQIAAYFTTITMFAYVVGRAAHGSVRWLNLDRRTEFFRFDNPWWYLLRGELTSRTSLVYPRVIDGVYLSATVAVGSEVMLYRGIVADFTFDDDGSLDTITIADAHRRLLADDEQRPAPRVVMPDNSKLQPVAERGDGEVDLSRYYFIKGDLFVLKYPEITTLNLDYFAANLGAKAPAP
jgi:hypothetical protein